MSARGHTANENARVGRHVLHAYAIAKQRPARERTRRIDRNDTYWLAAGAIMSCEPVYKGALAAARRPGDADDQGFAGVRKDLLEQFSRVGARILNCADSAADRALVPRKNLL